MARFFQTIRWLAVCWLLLPGTVVSFGDAPPPLPPFGPAGVQFLQKHCLRCHSGADAMASISLERFEQSSQLIPERKLWDNLARQLRSGTMPPQDEPQPSPAEIEAFLSQVQAIFAHSDRYAPPNPGRVTMRRLNRLEYRNTIRDLVGVTFDPTEDFPSDDIGHGFDNIGDVLSLSPVLMERYLAAAENVMALAITPTPPAVTKRHFSAIYTEPASGEVMKRLIENGYRRLSSDGKEPIEVGPINTPYQWEADGEYIFRVKVYGRSEAGPIRVAILLHGADLPDPSTDEELAVVAGKVVKPAKLLQVPEVTATSREKAQLLEVRLPPMAGRHRMQVGLIQPAEGEPVSTLYVEHFGLEGPLDTRPATQRRLLETPSDLTDEQRSHVVLERFLRRAYRRPPTPAEQDRVLQLAKSAQASGESWEAAMQFAMQATLCSPKFLFRVELDNDPQSPQIQPLNEHQLASRLSYFLWSSMPDDELLALAERGELTKNLSAQVQRMLADPKSQALVTSFVQQWLQIQRIDFVAPDSQLFPQFNEALRTSMLQETSLFVDSVFREDHSIFTLIDADYTFLNEPLANLYGLVDTNGNPKNAAAVNPKGQPLRGPQFQRVSLADRTRGGLLTQASVLTVTSNPTRTSPVKRGRWVLEQILGAPPPPPPPNVPELPASEQEIAGTTLRQRMEAHRSNPSCANCHSKMDPLGFALENFDAIGAFRLKDGEFPVDAAGELPEGDKFRGPAELKTVILAHKAEFRRCLTEKMLIYALGRGLEYYDRPTVDRIVQQLSEGDDRVSVLLMGIVKSDPFRQRRGATTE